MGRIHLGMQWENHGLHSPGFTLKNRVFNPQMRRIELCWWNYFCYLSRTTNCFGEKYLGCIDRSLHILLQCFCFPCHGLLLSLFRWRQSKFAQLLLIQRLQQGIEEMEWYRSIRCIREWGWRISFERTSRSSIVHSIPLDSAEDIRLENKETAKCYLFSGKAAEG